MATDAKMGKELTIWVHLEGVTKDKKVRIADTSDVADLCEKIVAAFDLSDRAELHLRTPNDVGVELSSVRANLAAMLKRGKDDKENERSVYVTVPGSTVHRFSGLGDAMDVSQAGSLSLPFQSREAEITTMANIILENFKKADEYSTCGQGAESQLQLTLIVAAQMLGSGKTTLGQNFLRQLQLPKFNELIEVKASNNDNMQLLLSLDYVMIDLRQMNSGLDPVDGLRSLLLQALLLKCPPELRKTLVDEFQTKVIAAWPCAKLVRHFSKLLNKKFFLHFDEVDRVAPLAELSRRLHDFWYELYLVQYDKNVLFFTGRSPALYLLGRGFYRGQELVRPNSSSAECILLDALKVEHVYEILNGVCADNERKQAAEIIIRRCSGVPRLVAHAVQFLKTGNSTESLAGNDFLAYLDTVVDSELKEAQALEGNARLIYIELIRLCSLGVPFDPLTTLEGELLGFPARTFKLEICASFPVYLEEVDTPNKNQGARKRSAGEPLSFRLAIPEVMLRRFSDPRLPFWRPPVEGFSSDGPTLFLEDLPRNCIRLRISEALGQAGGKPLKELMPFFTGSQVEAKPARFVGLKPFPKISSNPKPTTEAHWDTKEEQDLPFAEVNSHDKGKLLKLMEPYVIYHPKSKSSSSDVIYVLDGAIVEWRCTPELEPFTLSKLEVELSKTFQDYASENKRALTFVVVAFNVHEELTSKQPKATTHLHFKSETKLKTKTIPKHVDVIVLLKPGLSSFLTPRNVEALERLLNAKHPDTLLLETVAQAIQSPFKPAKQTSGN